MDAPAVSVITASRGRRELLLAKLDSLRRQTLAPDAFEWIVCLDGGRDGSAEALAAVSTPFRLEPIAFASRRGPGAARNACAARARGDVLYLSDDDCLLEPDTLARHLKAQRDAPGVHLGPIRFLADDAERLWRPQRVAYWNLNGANSSLPSAAFRAVGGFDATLDGYGGEDLLLGYRLWRHGLRFRPLPAAPVRHLGPDPMWGRDLAKARSAGRNAVRIARRHPELALRLGVHPLSLALKRVLLSPPLGLILKAARPATFAYERAYLQGAVAPIEERSDDDPR